MKNNGRLGLVGKILTGALAVNGLTRVANANAIIMAVPEQTTVVADGTTEYRMDVKGNTEEEVGKRIDYAVWQVFLPDTVTFTRSQLPDPLNNPSQNPDDFFSNFPLTPLKWFMDPAHNAIYNSTEPTTTYPGWSRALKQNERAVYSDQYTPRDGPSNVSDDLFGQYWFIVNPGATGETYSRLNGVKFTSPDNIDYKLSNGNLTKDEQHFNIVAPCWADQNGPNEKRDGLVDNYDFQAFDACRSGPQIPYATGCEWADFDADGDVDQDDFGSFQRCYSGDAIADANCGN